jgi:hypothetical protein
LDWLKGFQSQTSFYHGRKQGEYTPGRSPNVHTACKRAVLTLVLVAFCLIAGRTVCASEVSDLKAKLESLEKQIDKEKDKAKKEELKKQEKQTKAELKVAQERAKAAAKAKEKAESSATADAGKKKAKGFNKFARFWTEEVGKPMRKFFHGN